jgi:diacylglycerol kinase family enzyme
VETSITKKTSKKRKEKMTPEEKRAIMATIVPKNRSMKAFIEHQGEVWVKDPMLLL